METLTWKQNTLYFVDQRKLPFKMVMVSCSNFREVARAIKEMKIRGAPAIGIAAAYGMALAAISSRAENYLRFVQDMEKAGKYLANSRPTAVNLFWAIKRIIQLIKNHPELEVLSLKELVLQEARKMEKEDVEINQEIGSIGSSLINDGDNILTHCNAGSLATAGYGTALGVIRAAFGQGKKIHIYVDETRPLLQGARLTAWELMQDNIPCTLITDNMAGYLMWQKKIDVIIVGADRIASNGDVANKIGTYTLGVLAKENNLPFYIAAPLSTIDLSLNSGKEIRIEERNHREITHIWGKQIAPNGVKVFNPAFDITPHSYISGIITEKGMINSPFKEGIKSVFSKLN
ncbi:MAG: S-methyl-5-thioribose-1-phosphate isomerase [Candidatus Caldatribacteriota bacterium]